MVLGWGGVGGFRGELEGRELGFRARALLRKGFEV